MRVQRLIQHGVNTLSQLRKLPCNYGAEINIRDSKTGLVVSQEPLFMPHEGRRYKLETFLKHWVEHGFTGPLLLDMKTSATDECIALLKKYNVPDWVLHNLNHRTFTQLVRQTQRPHTPIKPRNLMVCFSEDDCISTVLGRGKRIKWVWADCLDHCPITQDIYEILKVNNGYHQYKICLVSPEIRGFDTRRIDEFAHRCSGMVIDAVCTNYPELWRPYCD